MPAPGGAWPSLLDRDHIIPRIAILRDNEGYDILHNGVWRSFRDTREAAFDAARFGKSRTRADIIEIVDRSTGAKMLMLEDGRAA